MSTGRFVVFEGVEGAGKTTQARLLSEWLGRERIEHVAVREPGGTALGEAVRRLLLESDKVPDRAELFLMLAARAAVVEEVVRPALEAGRVVIADRYTLSTLAYQGYGRGLPVDELRRMNEMATSGTEPDLTIVLDVDPAVGADRRAAAGLGADRIEGAGTDFHARVARAYRLLSESERGVERIDAAAGELEIAAAVRRLLRSRYPETFPSPTG